MLIVTASDGLNNVGTCKSPRYAATHMLLVNSTISSRHITRPTHPTTPSTTNTIPTPIPLPPTPFSPPLPIPSSPTSCPPLDPPATAEIVGIGEGMEVRGVLDPVVTVIAVAATPDAEDVGESLGADMVVAEIGELVIIGLNGC